MRHLHCLLWGIVAVGARRAFGKAPTVDPKNVSDSRDGFVPTPYRS